MAVDILAIGAHPDDIELGAGGTLLAHAARGYSIALLDLTRGEFGTRGTPEIRAEEAEKARLMLGAVDRTILDLGDGLFSDTEDTLQEIVINIRKYQPRIILANAISDRHPDHGRAADIITHASYLAGLRKYGKGDAWKIQSIYYYIQDYYQKPDFVMDISQFMNEKIELVMSYKSQFYDSESEEPDTPISGKDFLEFLRARAIEMGRPAGFQYAEGFTTRRWPGVTDLFSIK